MAKLLEQDHVGDGFMEGIDIVPTFPALPDTMSTVVIREKTEDARRTLDKAARNFVEGYMQRGPTLSDDRYQLDAAIVAAQEFHDRLLREAADILEKVQRAQAIRELKDPKRPTP